METRLQEHLHSFTALQSVTKGLKDPKIINISRSKSHGACAPSGQENNLCTRHEAELIRQLINLQNVWLSNSTTGNTKDADFISIIWMHAEKLNNLIVFFPFFFNFKPCCLSFKPCNLCLISARVWGVVPAYQGQKTVNCNNSSAVWVATQRNWLNVFDERLFLFQETVILSSVAKWWVKSLGVV